MARIYGCQYKKLSKLGKSLIECIWKVVNQQHICKRLSHVRFQEHLKASERRADTDDKADKPNAEPKLRPLSRSSPSPSPVLQPRRASPPPRSPTPSTSSLTPLPPSPVTHLKSEEGRQRVSSHPPLPLPHAPSPCSASPPPSSPRLPKDESVDDGRAERRRDGRKPAFQGIYSGKALNHRLCHGLKECQYYAWHSCRFFFFSYLNIDNHIFFFSVCRALT